MPRGCRLLQLLTLLVLIVHLLCVNVAAGAPILCVWLEWRSDAPARRAAGYLGRLAVLTLVAGGLLGAIVGWLKWTPAYRELWTGPLSYRLYWGAWELGFSLALAVMYWILARVRRGESEGNSVGLRIGRATIALLNGTNLLYHFPALFVVAGVLHDTGQTSGSTIGGAVFRRLAWSGETPPLSMHFALAAVATSGVMLLSIAMRGLRREDQAADETAIGVWGGRWALAASLGQIPVGLWTLAMLPAEAQSRLMGNEPAATLLFFAAMLAAFWLLRELAGVSLGEVTRSAARRVIIAMLLTISLMTAMQQSVRPSRPPSPSPAADGRVLSRFH